MDTTATTAALGESLASQAKLLDGLDKASKSFGKSLSDTFARAVVDGKKFDDVLRGLGTRLVEIGLKAAFKPVETAITSSLDQVLKGTFNAVGSAVGGSGFNLAGLFGGANAPLDIRPTPFAEGGVVAAPSFFPLGGGLGLAGERGAEAIMPLARGPDGRLGVASSGARPVAVTVNIAATDVSSFQRSEAQISAALARAVTRGQRGL